MDNSPLGKLPPETRNRVYEIVLRHPDKIKIWSKCSPVALLRTCHQARNECRQMFFAINTFVLRSYEKDTLVHILSHFLAILGDDNRAMLRQVLVVYQGTPIKTKDGANADEYHTALLENLKKLRQITKPLKDCSIRVEIQCDSTLAFKLQGLSPHVICDLKDFCSAWDEQIDAFHDLCEALKVFGSPGEVN